MFNLNILDQHHTGSFLLPPIPQKPPLRARHSSSTCHWNVVMIVQRDFRFFRACVSSASSPFSLKFWRQIPVQFLPLAITSTLSTLSTPSSYLHRDTVIHYPAKQVDILNQHLYATQFITFPSRWSGWHLWAQLGKKGFKEQLWRHVPWHAQPAKVLLQQSAGIFGTLVYMLKTALHSIRVTIYVYKCFHDC